MQVSTRQHLAALQTVLRSIEAALSTELANNEASRTEGMRNTVATPDPRPFASSTGFPSQVAVPYSATDSTLGRQENASPGLVAPEAQLSNDAGASARTAGARLDILVQF